MESAMRFGFGLPQIGPAAGPDSLVAVAKRAEELGINSLWVSERILYPLEPKTPYPGSPEGKLPYQYKSVLDPLDTLTFVAAHTSRVGLGTSTINLPYYNPVMLARRLTTIDVLSRGRLRVAFGVGWSEDECDAAGTPFHERGRRADEFIRALKAIWTSDPVEFHGQYFHIPKAIILPKPVQKPHPPIEMGAFNPRTFRRIATLCDGWNAVFLPPEQVAAMFNTIKQMTKEAGRDPSALTLTVRANGKITEKPLGGDRQRFNGSVDQVAEDVRALRAIGVMELLFDPGQSSGIDSVDDFLTQLERWVEAGRK